MADKWDCALCGGYAEGGHVWFGEGNSRVCHDCTGKLHAQFNALMGLNCPATEYGPEVQWHEVKALLDRMERDIARRTQMLTLELTDRALYEATV